MMVESRDHRLLSFLCVSGRWPRRCCSASSANPFPLPHLASAAPLVIARLLIQHLPSPTLFGRRARTLPRQARSASHLSRSLLIMGLGMTGCIWVHWPILLGKLAISVGTYRHIGVGRKYSTNAHNQWLMEIKPISMAVMAAWVRSEAPNLLSMRPTWFLTVLVLRSNSLAICSLVRPCDMSLKTSASRGESSVFAAAAGGVPSSCVVGASGTGLIHSSSTCFSCFSWLRRNRSRLVTS